MEDAYVLQLISSKFQDLYLCFCGVSECKPCHRFGPAIRPNYILHYILSGKGVYQSGGHKYNLQEGQGFLIEPDTISFYEADEKEPWTYLWIGFAGTQAGVYLQDLGLNSRQLVFQTANGEELKQIVSAMLRNNNDSQENQYYLQSLLYKFFSVLSREVQIGKIARQNGESTYVQRAVNFIRNNYFRGISVTDIAGHVGLSRGYLYKVFEENFKVSPKEFLTRLRIVRSKELLEVTELSIEGVAMSCGYPDGVVYSKAFKQVIGMPPSVYRKMHRRKQQEQLKSQQQDLLEMMETF